MLNLFKSLSTPFCKAGINLALIVLPLTSHLPAYAKYTQTDDPEFKTAAEKFSEFKDLFSCIDALPVFGIHPKWDFADKKCITGRKWINLPDYLKKELDRPLDQDEIASSLGEMKVSSPDTIAPRGEKPKAIILIGAGASGKSSMCEHLSRWVSDFNPDHYVQFDGDILRKYHKPYQSAIRDSSIGYIFAWQTLKPHIFATKKGILEQIIRERRNVMIPTGVHAQRYYHTMTQAGYSVSVVGVYVDFGRALYQGKNRAEYTGREYLGTRVAWETGVSDMLSLGEEIILENAIFEPDYSRFALLVDNRNFFKPELLDQDSLKILAGESM